MAKSSDYRMAIKIAGEIEKSLYNSTDLTRKELNKIAREAAKTSSTTKESFSRGLKETKPFFEGLEKAGVKAFKAVAATAVSAGTAVVGVGTMAAQAGIKYESSFAGVKKTTEATAQEYAQMRAEILAMTRDIPAVADEISEVAEAAGQLGIEKENLLSFSRTMIDLGESTNLSAGEAASDLAKFANIVKMSADNYDRLGSVIVDLGNNFATTESDIVSMGMNIASAGELAGFTESQIMAIATAISSVGIEVEAGGSAISKMIKRVQVAVETGSKDLEDYASVAGMTTDEFKEAFSEDALTAVAAFIGGLNDVERNGKSATVILDEMGLTEVRLSNTLLSLANADGLLLDAVETANTAWEENTALMKEAAQRYETTESKIAIMQNGFTEMGIAMYDQFNEPLREGIDVITELVHEATSEIAGSNVIHDLAQDIISGVPTAIRIIKDTTEAVGDFAEPFLEVGGWLADNPTILESTIVGVGTALMTYKTAQGISSMAKAFASLGASSLPVLGLTGVAAVIGGVTVAVKKSAEEAKRASLNTHFGNITLSMKELEETAAFILSNDSFGQLNETISELGQLDGISRSIDDTVTELNKMNWKVSLGMELKEEEQALYQQDIASYVSDVQAYLEQEQYAISLSVGVLTGEDLENSNIVTQLNEFYAGKSAELASLGEELNKTVTDAFQDGFLDIDEQKTIMELQQQMANIKASLAAGSYEANLDLLGMKYAAGELDADTFQNLLLEVKEQQEVAKQQYEEAYVAANQSQRAMLEDGAITQDEFDTNMKALQAGYLEQVAALDTKAADFAFGTVMQQYGDEIGTRIDEVDAVLSEVLGQSLESAQLSGNGLVSFDADYLARLMGGKLGGADGKALAELWEQMEPMYDQLEEIAQQYVQAGKDISTEMAEILKKAAMLGVLAGDNDSAYLALGVTARESEEYQEQIKEIYKKNPDVYMPESVVSAVDWDKESIENAAGEHYDLTKQALKDEYSNGMEVDANVNVNFRPASKLSVSSLQQTVISNLTGFLPGHAEGGIFDTPHVAWFSEDGPEAAIPIDGSQNAISLWERTGEMLGVFNQREGFSSLASQIMGDSGSSVVNNSEERSNITLSPVFEIHASENSNTEDLERVIRGIVNGEFRDMVEDVIREQARNRERYSFS